MGGGLDSRSRRGGQRRRRCTEMHVGGAQGRLKILPRIRILKKEKPLRVAGRAFARVFNAASTLALCDQKQRPKALLKY